jgi:hypothetical protein
MRFITFLGAICALSETALAQGGECKLVTDAAARLACYDTAAPGPRPAVARPSIAAPAMIPASKADGKYVDKISAEDALMNARLRNICRGC